MVLDFAREAIQNAEMANKTKRIKGINKVIDVSKWTEEMMDAFLLGWAIAKEEIKNG